MEWYKDFRITWQVFGFQSSDVWNMDKSGFMVGMGKNQKVITKDPCQKLYLGSSTNYKLVTVVEAISAGGRTMPPMVILPGKCQQEHWYDRTSIEDQALVAVSDSGFLNDELALEWVVTTQEEHSLYILTESSRQDTGRKYQTAWHGNQSRDRQDKPGGARRSMYMHEQVSKVSRAHPAHRGVHEK